MFYPVVYCEMRSLSANDWVLVEVGQLEETVMLQQEGAASG
ncbi:hypothetical protein Q4488_02710 [Amphritea sp. 1_MG-2023]|nr:hypothetical protein [Amphritea sp. 1_MG-2023]MDO6562285.1 hypothetical protein [Amphritea sp. 1_MG-2023]